MAIRILDREPRLGKRWPYRILNFLPSGRLWSYLTWKSGGNRPEAPFEICKGLQEARRLLIVLPEDVEEMLIALPVVQSHFQALPEAAIWLLAGPLETPFLSSIFGSERLLTLDPEQFFLGEEHFQDLRVRVQGMRPDMVLNFRTDAPPLVHALLRMSLAPLRLCFGSEPLLPFSNIALSATEPVNHLGHFQMAARLWDAAGIPMAGKWTRIDPSQDARARADQLLRSANLKPSATLLFPWQTSSGSQQLALFKEVAAAARAAGKTLAVVQAEGGLFASATPPLEVSAAYPCLKADSPAILLALFAGTAGTVGLRGPLLLLAGLTDADVTGYFTPEDAKFDTSALNAKLRIVQLEAVGA